MVQKSFITTESKQVDQGSKLNKLSLDLIVLKFPLEFQNLLARSCHERLISQLEADFGTDPCFVTLKSQQECSLLIETTFLRQDRKQDYKQSILVD